MRRRSWLVFAAALAALQAAAQEGEPGGLAQTAEAVRNEALKPNNGPDGRPLPLAANWNTGGTGQGFSPDWQMAQLAAGHRLLPWFPLAEPGQRNVHYDAALRKCAELELPVTFISTQWERLLTFDPRFKSLPQERNANVFGPDGKMQPKVSPFGPVGPWREAGRIWGKHPTLAQARKLYPNPPRVWFLSNNEHQKLVWNKVEEDAAYLAKYGTGKDESFKRKVVGDGWIERYRALQEGFRQGLGDPAWAEAARFAGYNAFGLETMGRWSLWSNYSLHVPGRFSPWPLAWDGGSPSFYTNNWEMCVDYAVYSPQVQCMNWVFMQKEALRDNPDFWFEMSVWDGHVPGKDNDKHRYYEKLGQHYGPERYAGMTKFGMWLTRPRVVREFRAYRETRAELEPYFQAVMAAVDEVHDNETLAKFWRKGELVVNRKGQHPYKEALPAEIARQDRWFRLDADTDPTGRWRLNTELHVFALALVRGKAPSRSWLVYAHAPTGDRPRVRLTLPEYGPVVVAAPVAGAYYLVKESDRSVRPVR